MINFVQALIKIFFNQKKRKHAKRRRLRKSNQTSRQRT